MFVMYEKDTMKVPVKVWLEKREDLEESCKEQAYHLAQLPFLHKWVNLMPDTHVGMGMPIGGVIAAKGAMFAYKDIDVVMGNQTDLVVPVKRLKTAGVVKG